MFLHLSTPRATAQRFLAPEVIQTSAMDCGPAALKCLLEGFGIPVSYGRLREACQTDVDGTSLDTLEDVARQLGLVVEQVMLPPDHLFLAAVQNLPALLVVQLPTGHPHFLIVWRTHGPWVQVMDPATGRRWLTQQRLLQEVYRHTLPIAATTWRDWAADEGLLVPLRHRLQQLGADTTTCSRLLAAAAADVSWFGLALLDAATRLVTSVVAARGVRPGAAALTLLDALLGRPEQGVTGQMASAADTPVTLSPCHLAPLSPAERYAASSQLIPPTFWSVRPLVDEGTPAAEPATLLLQGAVLVRVLGRQATAEPPAADHLTTDESTMPSPVPLAPDLVAALQEAPTQPEWAVWRALRADGLLTPTLVLVAATLATLGVLIEAALLRGVLALAGPTRLPLPPATVVGLYLLFSLLLAAMEFPLSRNLVRLGRRLEARLRLAFLTKLPRLGDRYFHSRLLADMAQRAYGLRQLRELPGLALQAYRTGWQLLLTALGVIWLAPNCAPLALLAVAWALGCSLLAQWVLMPQDGRVRTYAGALSRFYLDGLLGLIPLRTHAAERALRREHEGVLVKWRAASATFYQSDRGLQALEALGSAGCAIVIVFFYLSHGGAVSGVLLLLYWTLNLSALSQAFTALLRQYPAQRNHVLRVLEPLGAPEETGRQGDREIERQGDRVISNPLVDQPAPADPTPVMLAPEGSPPHLVTPSPVAVAIRLAEVTVLAGGHAILHDLTLTITAGEQVAIVGASGAGKSSLVGLLLGWHRPATGEVWVDDQPLTGAALTALRQQTAWVDPAVQLWNRSLWDNLRYGAPAPTEATLAQVLTQADLYHVLEQLPNGLHTALGEGGGLVAGGEGQRVRLGRALLRPQVRLAILDEPFRGLDRPKRQQLLRTARDHWRAATLLCITHDVSETQTFDRVLVMADGRIVEDGAPRMLAANPRSVYHDLLATEAAVHAGLWQGAHWRQLHMHDGWLQEAAQ